MRAKMFLIPSSKLVFITSHNDDEAPYTIPISAFLAFAEQVKQAKELEDDDNSPTYIID